MKERTITTVELRDISNVLPVFGGAGYLVELDGVSEIYFSKDAHASLLRYIDALIEKLEKTDGWSFSENVLKFGDVVIKSNLFYSYGVTRGEAPANVKELKAIRDKLDAGTSLLGTLEWRRMENSYNGELVAIGYDGVRSILLNPDSGQVQYNFSQIIDGEICNIAPAVEVDTSLVKLADKLYGIANTATFPDGDYDLLLEMGLGKLNLSTLSKQKLLECAQRLMP